MSSPVPVITKSSHASVSTTRLAPLLAPPESLSGVSAARGKLIRRIARGSRVIDLLFCLPDSITDRRLAPPLAEIKPDNIVTVTGTVKTIRAPTPRTRQPWRVALYDGTGVLEVAFFSPWQAKQIAEGEDIVVSGKAEFFHDKLCISAPDYVLPARSAGRIPRLDPVWPLTAGLFSGQVRQAMVHALSLIPEGLPEWHETSLISSHHWPDFITALNQVHFPDNIPGSESGDAWRKQYALARARLACDELLADQLATRIAQRASQHRPGRIIKGTGILQKQALETFGHALTPGQSKVLSEIEHDMAAPYRMNRLLQGDVGAGKTLVALLAMLRAVEAGAQAALMAPTEILARQHAKTFSRLTSVPVAYLSGSVKGKARKTVLQSIADGSAPLAVGTHALMQEGVSFSDLALAVVDEQHRFGVEQRLALVEKGHEADMLVMTATPIPRTLLLTRFGDMQTSRLEGKPAGRKPVRTSLHSISTMPDILDALERALAKKAQIFWVCPLVSESEALDIAAAEARHAELSARFGPQTGLAHGQQDTAVREKELDEFARGNTRLLVATTVIEVGVDIPAATIMVIEHAERFGLAQLHQLRGRVGRGSEASYCLMLHDDKLGLTARRRLNCLRDTEDGFIIANEDFRLRGGGDATGHRQSGLPEYRIAQEDLFDELLDLAHKEAGYLFKRCASEHQASLSPPLNILLTLFNKADAARLFSGG